jgi:hypothetical protein
MLLGIAACVSDKAREKLAPSGGLTGAALLALGPTAAYRGTGSSPLPGEVHHLQAGRIRISGGTTQRETAVPARGATVVGPITVDVHPPASGPAQSSGWASPA